MSKVLSTKLSGNSKIPVRKMGFDFSDVPKDYMNGSLAKSHLFDGLNLLFPEASAFLCVLCVMVLIKSKILI